jgi:hypothetical protein
MRARSRVGNVLRRAAASFDIISPKSNIASFQRFIYMAYIVRRVICLLQCIRTNLKFRSRE